MGIERLRGARHYGSMYIPPPNLLRKNEREMLDFFQHLNNFLLTIKLRIISESESSGAL